MFIVEVYNDGFYNRPRHFYRSSKAATDVSKVGNLSRRKAFSIWQNLWSQTLFARTPFEYKFSLKSLSSNDSLRKMVKSLLPYNEDPEEESNDDRRLRRGSASRTHDIRLHVVTYSIILTDRHHPGSHSRSTLSTSSNVLFSEMSYPQYLRNAGYGFLVLQTTSHSSP